MNDLIDELFYDAVKRAEQKRIPKGRFFTLQKMVYSRAIFPITNSVKRIQGIFTKSIQNSEVSMKGFRNSNCE